MNKMTFVKILNKSNLAKSSNYLKDQEHKEHLETYIDEKLNWKSQLLGVVSWKDIDDYEASQKIGRKKEAVHGKELVYSLPNENDKLIEPISDDEFILHYEKIEEIKDELLNSFFKESGLDPLKTGWEIQGHIDRTSDGQISLHFHLLFSDREINFERTQKRYKKDQWRDPDTNKLTKAGEGILYAKKGDLIFKNGEPVYENDGGATFSKKNREIKSRQFLERIKEATREIYQREFPEFNFYTGKNPELVHSIKWTKKMEEAHPQKAELIKQANSNIRNLNLEIQKLEPERRRSVATQANKQIDNKKADMKKENNDIKKQMNIIQDIINLALSFTRQVRDFLKKPKISYFTQKDFYGEPANIYKVEEKDHKRFIYQFDLRNHAVQYLGEFSKSSSILDDVLEASDLKEYKNLFKESNASELNRLEEFPENKQKIEPQRQISRGLRM